MSADRLSENPSIKVAMAPFVKLRVMHHHLKLASGAVETFLRSESETPIVMIIGTTAVGKSTLRMYLNKVLTHLAQPQLGEGQIPVLDIEALSPDSTGFNWRDFYARSLRALGDPFADKKLNYPMGGILRGQNGRVVTSTGTTTGALRFAFEESLKHRNPKAIIIDEAHHIAQSANPQRLQRDLETIKSIANMTRIPMILLGTYDLIAFKNLNGQLGRRTGIVHLQRYHHERPEDLKCFLQVLSSFQKGLPTPLQTDLLAFSDILYERSIGLVGLLKDWLVRACELALKEATPAITEKILQATSLRRDAIRQILLECDAGESAFNDADDDAFLTDSLRMRLTTGTPSPKKPTLPQLPAKKTNPPFRTAAKRRRTGTLYDAA